MCCLLLHLHHLHPTIAYAFQWCLEQHHAWCTLHTAHHMHSNPFWSSSQQGWHISPSNHLWTYWTAAVAVLHRENHVMSSSQPNSPPVLFSWQQAHPPRLQWHPACDPMKTAQWDQDMASWTSKASAACQQCIIIIIIKIQIITIIMIIIIIIIIILKIIIKIVIRNNINNNIITNTNNNSNHKNNNKSAACQQCQDPAQLWALCPGTMPECHLTVLHHWTPCHYYHCFFYLSLLLFLITIILLHHHICCQYIFIYYYNCCYYYYY